MRQATEQVGGRQRQPAAPAARARGGRRRAYLEAQGSRLLAAASRLGLSASRREEEELAAADPPIGDAAGSRKRSVGSRAGAVNATLALPHVTCYC
jgi:hypothetical protein